MPVSSPNTITPFLNEIKNINFKSLLDVGCGKGLYGSLIRNYFDDIYLIGMEGEAEYYNPLWKCYDQIWLSDVREPVKQKFDIVLLLDIIEHFKKDEGKVILDKFCNVANKAIFVATPATFRHNKGWESYPMETHRSLWGHEDFGPGWKRIEVEDHVFYLRRMEDNNGNSNISESR